MVDPAYIAGFFDGEGSIGLYASKKSRRYNLRVLVNQVISPGSELLFSDLQRQFGGSLFKLKTYSFRHRPAMAWSAYGNGAADFLEALRPHLRLKLPIAEAAIRWQREYPPNRALKNPARAEAKAQAAEAIMALMAPTKGPRRLS